MNNLKEVKELYRIKQPRIIQRLNEFKQLWLNGNDYDIFTELAFCILTPQSKAKICWQAIVNLKNKNLLLKGNAKQIKKELVGVRFKNKKAEYILSARKFFINNKKICIVSKLRRFFKISNQYKNCKIDNTHKCREWLVKNICGFGYKEASHFLRNIGLGEPITILDRHILKNLLCFEVIKEIPKSINGKKYLQIEKKMIKFANNICIPVSHLDLLLWCKETGEIFK